MIIIIILQHEKEVIRMKRISKLIAILLAILFIATACSSASGEKNHKESKMKDYKTESGKIIKVPKNPKRVAVLNSFYVGDFIELGIKPVAVPDFTKSSSILKPYLNDVKLVGVGNGNVEGLTNVKPDLIIADAMNKDINKYKKIAPTVTFTSKDYNHKEILKELGKLTGKEKKADQWIKNWEKQSKKDRKEIKEKIGNSTGSVLEPKAKNFSIYKNNSGRGLEIVHDSFGMPMPTKYEETVKKDKLGQVSVNLENISDYTGDFIFLSQPSDSNFEFENTTTWNNIPAVKKGRVIKYEAEDYWYSDPITLEHLRKELKNKIMKTP